MRHPREAPSFPEDFDVSRFARQSGLLCFLSRPPGTHSEDVRELVWYFSSL